MRPLSTPRWVSRLCWCAGEVTRSQTTAGRTKRSTCDEYGLLFLHWWTGTNVERWRWLHLGSHFVVGVECQAEHDDLEDGCAMQRRGGPGSNQGNGRVVEQTWLPGVDCQVTQWTSHVSISWRRDQRIEGTFWCQSSRTSSITIWFRVRWHGGECRQTGQGESANSGDCDTWIARCSRESWARGAGVVCAFRWSDHFPYCGWRRWTHRIPTCISTRVSPRSHAFRVERKDLEFGSEEEEDPDHRPIFRRYLLWHLRRFWGVRCWNTCWLCGVQICPVFFKGIRGTPRRLLLDDEPREPRKPREQPLRIDVRPVHTDLLPPTRNQPSHVTCTSESQLSWLDRGTPLDASAVKQPWLKDLRVITRNSVEHESSNPCLQMLPSVYESGMRTKEFFKKVRFAEHATEHVPPAVTTLPISSIPVTYGPSRPIPSVVHARLDDSDERAGSKELNLLDLGDLPSGALMSSDVHLSSADLRVECLLKRFERERDTNKSSVRVLNRIAGGVSDEQVLEVAGLDGPARSRIVYDMLKLWQSLHDIHVAEIFSKPKTLATSSRMGLTHGLIFDMSRSCCEAFMDLQSMDPRDPKFHRILEAGLSHLKSGKASKAGGFCMKILITLGVGAPRRYKLWSLCLEFEWRRRSNLARSWPIAIRLWSSLQQLLRILRCFRLRWPR